MLDLKRTAADVEAVAAGNAWDYHEAMSGRNRNTATSPHRSALHHEGLGFAVTVLPASPYEVSYSPAHHVIGFTFAGQRGIDAFGGSRRRLFEAEPWRLAFTPAGAMFSRPRTGAGNTWC
jgi:hypothetical protein